MLFSNMTFIKVLFIVLISIVHLQPIYCFHNLCILQMFKMCFQHAYCACMCVYSIMCSSELHVKETQYWTDCWLSIAQFKREVSLTKREMCVMSIQPTLQLTILVDQDALWRSECCEGRSRDFNFIALFKKYPEETTNWVDGRAQQVLLNNSCRLTSV